MSNLKFFKQLSTYLLHILLRTIVKTRFLWTDIYTKKYLRITVIRLIGVTPKDSCTYEALTCVQMFHYDCTCLLLVCSRLLLVCSCLFMDLHKKFLMVTYYVMSASLTFLKKIDNLVKVLFYF